jgi:YegS/Rv2252/BmrU family lipid kinase
MQQETDTNSPLWHVIINPHAGCNKGRRDLNQILYLLNHSGLTYKYYISEFPGHIIKIARELASARADHFIIAGGDGSLNEAVNGFFSSNLTDTDKILVGVIPVGTGNDWIRTFGIPDSYEKALQIIKKGKSVFQDVGEIFKTNNTSFEPRYFVNIVGFGFDAMVAGHANKLKDKGMKGWRVYIQSFLWSYKNFKSRKTKVKIDDEVVNPDLFSISVGLGKYNGGGMMQVPDANPLKGYYHVTIIRKMSIGGILKNFKGLYSGSFLRDKRVSTHIGKTVEISSEPFLQCEADGESLGEGNFSIKLIPHKLKVIYGDGREIGIE